VSAAQGAVVVGTDGSAASQQAVDWAFNEAAASASRLHIVHAIDSLPVEFAPALHREMLERADEVLGAAERQRPPDADIEVTSEKVESGAARALLDASKDAKLVVVASRGRGGFSGLLLGSVSQHVAQHANCPAVVVRVPAKRDAARVVVGLDARAVSEPAVRLAFEFAHRHGQPLTAVHVWHDVRSGGAMAMSAADLDDRARSERLVLEQAISRAREQFPTVGISETVTNGHPARVLAAASEQASTVVVGSRGRGAFAGMLLGSTSQALLHHAHCPVVIAR
jgi:nucleotide-binding universal stress UspA family protein